MSLRVLHVLNYGWPHVDGYTARSIGLIAAQRRTLGLEVAVATSPFAPLAKSSDPDFVTPEWAPDLQSRAATLDAAGRPIGPKTWERPDVGLSPATSAMFQRELSAIAARFKPDLIHTHHPHHIARTALRVARERGVPGVYEIRCLNGDYDLDARNPYYLARGRLRNALEFTLCRQASAVVTIGRGLAERLKAAGAPSDRVFVVRNSVDQTVFKPNPGTKPDVDDGRLRVGYATTFEKIENLDGAVRAAGLAAKAVARTGRRLRMILAGTGRDWPRIRALVDEMGLQDVVELPGFVPYGRMPDFYRSLDLFLVPRKAAAVAKDTTPLKPLEAAACGLPLLVSDLPAMRELLGDAPAARYVRPDAAAMAEALAAFARKPWAGGLDVSDRTWVREVEKYRAVYDAALAHGPPARSRPTGGDRREEAPPRAAAPQGGLTS